MKILPLALLFVTFFIVSCKDQKCAQFTPHDFSQKLALLDKSQFSTEELALLNRYFEKYKIRTLENAKDIRVKDKKFALIEAQFPLTDNFCDAIEAERAFEQKLGTSFD